MAAGKPTHFKGPKGEKISVLEWNPKKTPTVVFAHWYNGKKEDWGEWPEVLADEGYHVITFDFPRPHEVLHNIKVLRAILNGLKGNIGLLGYSLGGSASINIATENKRITCLVTIVAPHSHFTNETGRHNLRVNILEKAKLVNCPWLLMHGDKDEVVPLQQGRELYAVAKAPKKFVLLKGASHSLDAQNDNIALQEFVKWFKRYLK